MKKKRQQKTTTTTTAPELKPPTAEELKAQIHEHGVFFDKLIELIPAKFYLPNDDDPKPWYKGLSKHARASLKQQTRENIKLSRRQRLDPEKVSQSSTLDLLNQSLNKKDSDNDNDKDDNDDDDVDVDVDVDHPQKAVVFETKDMNLDEDTSKKDATYEELREKLRKKIESLRGNRGNSEKNDKRLYEERKRKRDGGDREKNVEVKEKEDEELEKGIEYGKLKIGDEEKRNNKKRKMSKAHELERAKKLKEAKKENPFVAEKESWKAAVSRAMGEKVHDDPRLLKESLKRDKKRKEKNAEKWKERVGRTEKMKGDRQQKRKENIAGRAKDKKARKIAKREKKLMRPGFEGRKEGFITKD